MVTKRKFGYETTDGWGYDILKAHAKTNRKYPTEAESVLWQALRGKRLGVHFRRQHPIDGYIADYVCLSHNLVVEIDGQYHFYGNQPIKDDERTAILQSRGYKVVRFTNEEVLHSTESVINIIRQSLKQHYTMQQNEQKTHPNPPKGRESMKTSQQNPNPTPQDGECTSNSPIPAGTPSLWEGRGGLIVVSAPSGSGKSTIINWLMSEHPELNLAFSISCTSRAPRGTEQNGVEYFFLTPEEFRQKIENDEFLEYEEVYEGRFYGTLKSQIETQTQKGQNVVFDVDVKGGCAIKQHYGDRALSLFIQPPSIEELRRRLEKRGTDTPEVIDQRIARAEYELTYAERFDRVVVNDDLATAEAEALAIIQEFLAREPCPEATEDS